MKQVRNLIYGLVIAIVFAAIISLFTGVNFSDQFHWVLSLLP